VDKTFRQLNKLFEQVPDLEDEAAFKAYLPIKNFLLRHGITWSKEFDELWNGIDKPTEAEQNNWIDAWSMRISLKIVIKTYEVSHSFIVAKAP
jgi:hypothetical protein